MTNFSLEDPVVFPENTSPRYWLLWTVVLITLLYSFTDVFISILPSVIGKHPKIWTVRSRNLNKPLPVAIVESRGRLVGVAGTRRASWTWKTRVKLL